MIIEPAVSQFFFICHNSEQELTLVFQLERAGLVPQGRDNLGYFLDTESCSTSIDKLRPK